MLRCAIIRDLIRLRSVRSWGLLVSAALLAGCQRDPRPGTSESSSARSQSGGASVSPPTEGAAGMGWEGRLEISNSPAMVPRPGDIAARTGDEIVAAGQFFHTGTRVVLWIDQGGYDAYRVERRFSPIDKAGLEQTREETSDLVSPNRYDLRRNGLTDEEIERVRGGGWDLPTLQRVVDQ